MSTTDQIEQAAHDLGRMIASHPSATEYDAASKALSDDRDAERLLNDFNRHLTALSEKQQKGEPTEVDDKRKLQELQQSVAMNVNVGRMQKAQMDYADLLRKVTEIITGESQPADAPPGRPQAGQ